MPRKLAIPAVALCFGAEPVRLIAGLRLCLSRPESLMLAPVLP